MGAGSMKAPVIRAAPVVPAREARLERLEALVAEAADPGPRLMVLPERRLSPGDSRSRGGTGGATGRGELSP